MRSNIDDFEEQKARITSEQRKRILIHGKHLVREAIRKVDAPELLHHYTTGDGFIGIMGQKQIWATNVGYMNDTREFVQGTELLRQAAASRLSQQYVYGLDEYGGYRNGDPLNVQDNILSVLIKHLDSTLKRKKFRTYVVCFSECFDDLAQWRGYSGNQSKFAIGFDGAHLNVLADALTHDRNDARKRYQRCFLAPAIYDPHQQQFLVDRMIGFILDQFPRDQEDASDGSDPDFARVWVEAYMKTGAMALALLKNERFNGEREWRLVVNPSSNADLRFRDRASMLTPYLEVPLDIVEAPNISNGKATMHPMRKLWVGPATHIKGNVAAADMFLDRHGYPEIMVEPSTVPYRIL